MKEKWIKSLITPNNIKNIKNVKLNIYSIIEISALIF